MSGKRRVFVRVRKDFYGVSEAADILKVSEATVYRLISGKEVKAERVGGEWRIADAEIMRLLMAK